MANILELKFEFLSTRFVLPYSPDLAPHRLPISKHEKITRQTKRSLPKHHFRYPNFLVLVLHPKLVQELKTIAKNFASEKALGNSCVYLCQIIAFTLSMLVQIFHKTYKSFKSHSQEQKNISLFHFFFIEQTFRSNVSLNILIINDKFVAKLNQFNKY